MDNIRHVGAVTHVCMFLSIPQTTWICEKLLVLWLALRENLPRDNSILGFIKAVLQYQKTVDPDRTVTELDSDKIGHACMKYSTHTPRVTDPGSLGLDPDKFTPGPMGMCPACHKECDAICVDCCMKTVRFHRPGKNSGLASEDAEGKIFSLPYEQISQYLDPQSAAAADSTEDPGISKACASNYKAARSEGKRSKRFATTGMGALACRHFSVPLAFLLRHGERYGYALAALEEFMARCLKSNTRLGKVCASIIRSILFAHFEGIESVFLRCWGP
jgi:hypothetical protein